MFLQRAGELCYFFCRQVLWASRRLSAFLLPEHISGNPLGDFFHIVHTHPLGCLYVPFEVMIFDLPYFFTTSKAWCGL